MLRECILIALLLVTHTMVAPTVQAAGTNTRKEEPAEDFVPDWATKLRDMPILKPGQRAFAWGLAEEQESLSDAIWMDARRGEGEPPFLRMSYRIEEPGGSLVLEHHPREIAGRLMKAAREQPGKLVRLSARRADQRVEGGNGLNPRPARSLYGTALLFGVGAIDSGIGKHHYKRVVQMLKDFGYFQPQTRFIPFWSTDARFRHTAPGVLCSAYVNEKAKKALMVLVNYTDRHPGKMGDVLGDHQELLGVRYPKCRAVAPLLGTSVPAHTIFHYNRKTRHYTQDVWGWVGVEPGDVRYVIVEPAEK